jgi:uncharacterized protein (TIGR02246 family)
MNRFLWVCALSVVFSSATIVQAEESESRAAIGKVIKSYVAAFNAGDAKALAAHWSPDGVYTSRTSGEQISGRVALEKDFTALFSAEKGTKLEVSTKSIDFISPNVVLERGMATVLRPKAEPDKTSYRVVYVKRDGKWLIDRTTEEAANEPLSSYDKLKDLEWMIGDWVDQEGGEVVETKCKWTRNKNFITRTFTIKIDDQIDLTGMQFVGWDPARKQIRSWVFDSDGGFSQGVWRKSGKQWVVQRTATLPSGKLASSTSILQPLDKDRFGWQKINRVVGGEILPNIDEVVIIRK